MTHPPQFTGSREAIQLLAEHGFDGLASALELLLNEVMKLERVEVQLAAGRGGGAAGAEGVDRALRGEAAQRHLLEAPGGHGGDVPPGAERVGDAYFGFYLLAMGSGRARRSTELMELLRAAGFSRSWVVATRMPLQTGLVVGKA